MCTGFATNILPVPFLLPTHELNKIVGNPVHQAQFARKGYLGHGAKVPPKSSQKTDDLGLQFTGQMDWGQHLWA